jgi:hypothetical protein
MLKRFMCVLALCATGFTYLNANVYPQEGDMGLEERRTYPTIQIHTIVDAYSSCKVDQYNFVLDDESLWVFPATLYEQYNLSLDAGDEVEISSVGDNLFLMNPLSSEFDMRIIFEKAACGVHCYYALEVNLL